MIKWSKTAYITIAVLSTIIVLTVIVMDAIKFGKEAVSTLALLVPMIIGFVSKIDGKEDK